jgi:hypothetical protein
MLDKSRNRWMMSAGLMDEAKQQKVQDLPRKSSLAGDSGTHL